MPGFGPTTSISTFDSAAATKRPNPVAPAQRSHEALNKAARKRTHDNTPVHSLTSLLADLATICANQIQPTHDTPTFTTPPPRCSGEPSNSSTSPTATA